MRFPRATRLSPTQSCDARRRTSESTRPNSARRTLEIGRLRKSAHDAGELRRTAAFTASCSDVVGVSLQSTMPSSSMPSTPHNIDWPCSTLNCCRLDRRRLQGWARNRPLRGRQSPDDRRRSAQPGRGSRSSSPESASPAISANGSSSCRTTRCTESPSAENGFDHRQNLNSRRRTSNRQHASAAVSATRNPDHAVV